MPSWPRPKRSWMRPRASRPPFRRRRMVRVVVEGRLGVALQLLMQARDRGGEVPQGRAARAHLGGAPGHAVARVLLLEARQHARLDQRGLAAARAAVDHDQPGGGEPVEHGIDHRLAAEEDRPLVLLERPQAGIGACKRRPRAHALRSKAPWSQLCRWINQLSSCALMMSMPSSRALGISPAPRSMMTQGRSLSNAWRAMRSLAIASISRSMPLACGRAQQTERVRLFVQDLEALLARRLDGRKIGADQRQRLRQDPATGAFQQRFGFLPGLGGRRSGLAGRCAARLRSGSGPGAGAPCPRAPAPASAGAGAG